MSIGIPGGMLENEKEKKTSKGILKKSLEILWLVIVKSTGF